MTIPPPPTLELMGAVLSSRLAQNILKVITVDRTTSWTDSENVWYWVPNQSHKFKPFLANWTGEIQQTTSPEQWRHVPGMVNPADLPTRGLSAVTLAESEVWMEGPAFLKDDESTWPAAPPPETTLRRLSTVKDGQQPEHTWPGAMPLWLLTQPNSQASSIWFMWQDGFSDSWPTAEFQWIYEKTTSSCLPRHQKQRPSSKLKPKPSRAGENEGSLTRLNPKNDSDGLLQMDGCFRFADELPYSTRHPILLPKDHL